MSHDDRVKFLLEVRVAVIGIAMRAHGGLVPIQVPIWYSYSPDGDVLIQTMRASLKAKLIHEAGRFSICVQDENPPYRYVSVEGPVVAVGDPLDPADRELLARRYLDPVTAEAYLEANRHQLTDDITFRMRPQRWRTADFSAFASEFS